MRIEHIALWTKKLEEVKTFYVCHFGGMAGKKFHDSDHDFSSYFVSFGNGTRIELMSMPSVPRSKDDVSRQFTGYIHIAFKVESREQLQATVQGMRAQGVRVLEDAHETADGYWEATILDPDGNRIELAVLPDELRQ